MTNDMIIEFSERMKDTVYDVLILGKQIGFPVDHIRAFIVERNLQKKNLSAEFLNKVGAATSDGASPIKG